MATRLHAILGAALLCAGPLAAQQTPNPDAASPAADATSTQRVPASQTMQAPIQERPQAASTGANTLRQAPDGPVIAEQKQGQLKTDDLVGTTLIGPDGQKIGAIDALLMEDNGQVIAAVVGVGGFLGIGEKDVALPWRELAFETDAKGREIIRVAATRADLQRLPRFRTLAQVEAEKRAAAHAQRKRE